MPELVDLVFDPASVIDDADLAAILAQHFGLRGSVRTHFGSERDQTVLFVEEVGAEWVVKVSHAATRPAEVDLEGSAAMWVHQMDPDLPVAVPRATLYGELYAQTPRLVRVYERLPGMSSCAGATLTADTVKEYGATAARLARALRGFFHPAAQRRLLWHVEARHQIRTMTDAIGDLAGRALVVAALDRFEQVVAPVWPSLRAQPVHSDLTLDNVLLGRDGNVCGVIDFGDLTHTALIADVAVALGSACSTRMGSDLLSTAALFLDGYTALYPLEPIEREVLADTLALRMAITVTLSANRARMDHGNADYLGSWDANAWNVLSALHTADRGALATAFGAPGPRPSRDALLARRAKVFGSVLAPLTYDEPLWPVRGTGATLVDTDGRTFIDAYNNVPVVGHAHPRVASAVGDQTRLLSTNLRYLHPRAIELAERLIASLPAGTGLDTVLFANSGSEATDLAWRIATAVTGHTGALVTDFAYHGVTTATTAFSPEQWRGGWAPDHVERFSPGADLRVAVAGLAKRGHRPALLCLDPTYTSDGILMLHNKYHHEIGDVAHRAGALVLADEVQAGFGRSGDHLWAFVGAGLSPDLVTLGKPMGNGYPVAAVIARRADVAALAAETELFSTYAGGPVAAAAAMAVLDVIADERLIEHARDMGALLRKRLLASGCEVRGRGLLIGVQLDSDASAVLDEARRRGVLIGSTGPNNDVLKIRPPMVITPRQVERVAAVVLDAIKNAAGQQS